MREARDSISKYGDTGLSIRTTTSTKTETVNGKTTVTTTVKTFHNDKLVKITENGVEQPLQEEMREDRDFITKYGDAGLSIRTTTSTKTITVNGKTTVIETVKTFHNDKLVK